MIPQGDIELFDRYKQGVLSIDDKSIFESRLQSDDNFRNDYHNYRVAVDAIKVAGIKRDLERIQDLENRGEIYILKKTFWIPMAASLLLATVSLFFLNRNSTNLTEELFNDYYKPYPNVAAFRGISTNLSIAFEEYSKQDFVKAETLFRKISNDTALFYRGICKLSLNQADSSLILFDQIPNSSIFNQQVNWYSGLAFLMKGNYQSARNRLRKIQKGQYKYSATEKILSEISEK
ncbi:MAG: hypothetical protein ACKO1F_14510 [Flammeovirgaceae bacterium]